MLNPAKLSLARLFSGNGQRRAAASTEAGTHPGEPGLRLCFVGHSFHRRTGSCAFFLEILRSLGSVSEYYADPDGEPSVNDALAAELIGSRFDRYIFWQTERIAERLLPAELGPSFIVPMYDSIAHVPDIFWLKFVKHRFISFSRTHHERLQRLGCATSHFQYFPDPGPEPARQIPDDERTGFFWERKPEGPVNLASVLDHCRALGIGSLHVHAASDFPRDGAPHREGVVDGVELSLSSWIEARSDYDRLAGRPLFFFAPRPLEGIGMASLEAMGRGQIVVAPDHPATNEYVAHLSSGLLYGTEGSATSQLPRLDREALTRMSQAARRKAVEGRRTWLGDVERLKSIIAMDGQRWSTTDDSAGFGRLIRRAARERLSDGG